MKYGPVYYGYWVDIKIDLSMKLYDNPDFILKAGDTERVRKATLLRELRYFRKIFFFLE